MGTTRDDGSQQSMWVSAADLPRGGGHPFYERLNRILEAAGFDAFVEGLCAQFYVAKMGRPSLAPGAISACCWADKGDTATLVDQIAVARSFRISKLQGRNRPNPVQIDK